MKHPASFYHTDPLRHAIDLEQAFKGLSTVADHLFTHQADILSISKQLNGIVANLHDLAERFKVDVLAPSACNFGDDWQYLRGILQGLRDSMFASFKRCAEIDIDLLWLGLKSKLEAQFSVSMLEHLSIVADFAGCFPALIDGSRLDPRFPQLRAELLSTAGAGRSDSDSDRSEDLKESSVASADKQSTACAGVRVSLPQAPLPSQVYPKLDPNVQLTEAERVLVTRPAFTLEAASRAASSHLFPKIRLPLALSEATWNLSSSRAAQQACGIPDFGSRHVDRKDCAKGMNADPGVAQLSPVHRENFTAVPPTEDEGIVTASAQDRNKGPQSPVRTRWWHLQQPTMSFAEFRNTAIDAVGPETVSAAVVAKVLSEVRRRSAVNGGSDAFVPCDVFSNTSEGSADSQAGNNYSVLFMSFPYSALNPPSDDDVGQGNSLMRNGKGYSIQTLSTSAESNYGSAADRTRPKNVPQVWFLVVGRNLVITRATLSPSALRKNFVSAGSTTRKALDPAVEVRTAHGHRAWLVPKDTDTSRGEDTSLLTLMAAFGERVTDMGGCDPLASLTHNEESLDPYIWHAILADLEEPRECGKVLKLQPTTLNIGLPNMQDYVKEFGPRIPCSWIQVCRGAIWFPPKR